MKRISLTDEQIRILGVCLACQGPVPPRRVRERMAAPDATPALIVCRECEEADDKETVRKVMNLGLLKLTELMHERMKKAGLDRKDFRDQYREYAMRQNHEQN